VAERLVDTHQAFYRIFFLELKGLVDTHQGFYRKALLALKRLVVTTKLFIEFNFGIKKAGGYPPNFLKNIFFGI
jgi:hypothetical protein